MNYIVVCHLSEKNAVFIYAKNTYKNKNGNIFKINKAKYV